MCYIISTFPPTLLSIRCPRKDGKNRGSFASSIVLFGIYFSYRVNVLHLFRLTSVVYNDHVNDYHQ